MVIDGENALGHPSGSVILGAFYGGLTALGLAIIFTMSRKYPDLAVVPAGALGAIISGILGFSLSSLDIVLQTPLWSVLIMGCIILPISFTCLFLAPRYTSSAIVSLIMLLEMVLGPLWVWIGIGERPSITMIFGSAIVLFGILIYIAGSNFSYQEKIG